jgi:predicted aminopeptidase
MHAKRAATTALSFRRRLAPFLVAVSLLPLGCYYAHLASGQTRMLIARQSIGDLLAEPATPPELADRLRLAATVRAFASELGLDVGEQYTSYVDWPGDRVVTTVVATRPGEVEARGFWFPLIGRVPYKGFFELARAEREAARLAADGLDTCLVPVLAYSTLGWMADPLTAPLARSPRLAETLIHELVHATVYLPSEPDFNEGLATFVGQEGAVRFAERDGAEAAARERIRVTEDRRVAAELQAFRDDVRELYASAPPGSEREAARAERERSARAALAGLPLTTRDPAWLAANVRLNDACQALAGTYQGDLARYARALEADRGDLSRFLARALEAAEAPDPRAALLPPAP